MFKHILLLTALGGSFLVLCGLVWKSLRPAQSSKWAAYSPAQVKKLWLNHRYVAIEQSDEFRAAILARTKRLVAANPELLERAEKIADLYMKFLAAYSGGDFHTFWTFLTPTGRYVENSQKAESLKAIIRDVQMALQASNIEFKPSTERAAPEPATGIKDLFAQLWSYDDALRERRRLTPEMRRLNSLTFCTKCLKEVAFDSMEIAVYSEAKEVPDIQSVLASRENIGVVVQRSNIDVDPAPFSTPKKNRTAFISVGVNIKTDFDFCHPIFIVAYWNSVAACYIPYMLAIPSSSRERAFMLF